ncbi:Vitamin B12 import ATP-binding protein BtuD [Mixta theicola]|nr:vitamin B12 ABC transporter ATP-binding protein BtuD [Mixta theicola]QHM75648.1 Vitamin B12 import ATP-binding protein BtuD [Mixta theicola]
MLSLEQAAVAGRLHPCSAQARAGEIIHLLGPNGAGKSTLLARAAGLLSGQGEVRLDGRLLKQWAPKALARRRAWLPQQQPPPGEMAVWHYLQQHLAVSPTSEPLLPPLLRAFQLENKLARSVLRLSGGEWQRVRLMAVLLQVWPQDGQPPGVLLLDEPYGGLDVAQQRALDNQLGAFRAAGGTVMLSGHDLNHSLRHAQRVWLMRRGELIYQGEVETVMQPATLNVVYGLSFRRLEADGESWLITEESG